MWHPGQSPPCELSGWALLSEKDRSGQGLQRKFIVGATVQSVYFEYV